MTDKKRDQPESDKRDRLDASGKPIEKKTKPTEDPHGSQVPDVNPPSVQPGYRDREQV